MKIAIVTPEYRQHGGGIATFYRELVPAFQRAGIDVEVVEASPMVLTEGAVHDVNGVSIRTLDSGRYRRAHSAFSHFTATPIVRAHLAAAYAAADLINFGEGYDLVEAADWGLLFAPLIAAGRVPVVVQGHASIGQIATHDPTFGAAPDEAFAQLVERAFLQHATGLQTYSDANAAFWREETGRDVEVIRPAFAVQASHPLGVGTDWIVFGRLQRWKGPDVLCGALEILGPRAPTVRWYGRDVAWGAEGVPTSKHLANEFPNVFGRALIPMPPVPFPEVAPLQAAARVNIVPSSWDVFNFTVVEAMASGRPVVASTGAGASELIEDGTTGFLFAAGDPASLAETIGRVGALGDATLAAVGEAARARVADALDPDAIAALRIAAYRRIAAAPRSPLTGWLAAIVAPNADVPSEAAELAAHMSRFPAGALARHLAARTVERLFIAAAGRKSR